MAAKRIWILISFSLVLALILGGQPASFAAVGPEQRAVQPTAPQAGGLFSAAGGDFLVSTTENGEFSYAAAANPTDDQFLVVWRGSYGMYGQIYNAQGLPLGANFLISTGGSDPAVAFSSASHEYLVVWQDSRNSPDNEIYGQRLSAAGLLLDNPTTPASETTPDVNFPIATGDGSRYHPVIAYNPLADEYLVVWDFYQGTEESYDIYGKRVDSDGYLLNNPGTPADEHDPQVSFAISTAEGNQMHPAIAFNLDDEQYLVAWQDGRAYGGTFNYMVFGQRLDVDGDLVDNPGTSEVETDPVVNFLISEQTDCEELQAAYNRAVHEYLVVWQIGPFWEKIDIYGQRLSRLGTLLDNPATTPDESDPAINYAIVVKDTNQTIPQLEYNPIRHEYMLAWQSERQLETYVYDVYGMRLDELLQPKPPEDFAISDSPRDQSIHFLVFNTASQQYLFGVGLDDENDDFDKPVLRLQRVFWPGILLGHEIVVWAAADDQVNPAVAYNSRDQETLVAWSDWRAGTPAIYAQRYDRDGLAIGSNFKLTSDTDDQIYPTVAYSSIDNCYLAAWESGDHSKIKVQLLSAQGSRIRTPVTLSSGAANTRYRPAAVYISNLQDNSFFVVYERVDASSRQIIGNRVYPDGAVSALISVMGFGVSQYPQVAYSATDNRLLVVYDYDGDIMGRTIEPNGSAGSYRMIGQGADSQSRPAVTWNAEDNQFLAVWQDYRLSGTQGADVYGQLLDSAGEDVGADFAISTASGTSNQQYPCVVYASDQDAYRIVWQDDRDGGTGWDIRGNWVSRGGAVLHSLDDPLSRVTGWQLYPALAYMPNYKKALVAWQDGRDTEEYDIYASFGAADATPPVARFTRDPIWGREGDTFTLNAWPSYDETTPRGSLLVRWDFNNDGTWDTDLGPDKYITRTVTTAGIYPIKLEVWDRSFNTSSITRPIVVLGSGTGDAPLAEPPTAAMTIDPASAAAGSEFEFDGSASTGSGTLLRRWDWENDGEFETDWSTDVITTHIFTTTGDHTVRMEVRQDNGTGLSSAVTHNLKVTPAALASLQILPDEAKLVPGESLQWRLRGLDIFDNILFNPQTTWSMLNAQAGSISTTGMFTASLQVGSYAGAVQAESGAVNDTASVTIYYPYRLLAPVVMKR